LRHICGNGHLGCVNPYHLRVGTQKENAREVKEMGRHPSQQLTKALGELEERNAELERIRKERDRMIAELEKLKAVTP
jgi:histidinol-phosphate/aromatic aminotransferase/cobyric acid decarboxylase-like protein